MERWYSIHIEMAAICFTIVAGAATEAETRAQTVYGEELKPINKFAILINNFIFLGKALRVKIGKWRG